MTGRIADAAGTYRVEEASHVPPLPLVSVVIVNYNYGRFLAEAVESVFAQTYPHVECVVVDNASTDESDAVLAVCQTRHPGLRVLKRERNGGQTIACVEGLASTRGPYVVFLDADDYLLPRCLETHVAVHLSSRVAVGFTSADMLQIVDGQTVLGTSGTVTKLAAKVPDGEGHALLRPTAAALGRFAARGEAIADHVYLVPRAQDSWVWSPTSGNCFRRDALDLLCDGPDLGSLMSQTDLYLALGVNATSGSIVIDEPLFAYRLHGANVFTNRPHLQGFLTFDVKRSGEVAALARRLLVDQLVDRIERFVQEPGMAWSFYETLKLLDTQVSTPGPWCGRSYAVYAVVRRYDAVLAVAGELPTKFFLQTRVPVLIKLRLVLKKMFGRPAPQRR